MKIYHCYIIIYIANNDQYNFSFKILLRLLNYLCVWWFYLGVRESFGYSWNTMIVTNIVFKAQKLQNSKFFKNINIKWFKIY